MTTIFILGGRFHFLQFINTRVLTRERGEVYNNALLQSALQCTSSTQITYVCHPLISQQYAYKENGPNLVIYPNRAPTFA